MHGHACMVLQDILETKSLRTGNMRYAKGERLYALVRTSTHHSFAT